MDLTEILHQILLGDKNAYEPAQELIDAYASLNLDVHLLALANFLADIENVEIIRNVAAIQIVTTLKSGDPLETRIDCSYRWFSIDAKYRQNIKEILLKSLVFEPGTPSFIADCLTFIAELEFCRDESPDLINILIENILQINNPDALRRNSLKVIGLLAQKYEDEHCKQLDSKGNEIFEAIFRALKQENSDCIKMATIETLMHWMRFTPLKPLYENDVVCALGLLFECTEDDRFLSAALKSLTGILKKYNTSLSYPVWSHADRLFVTMMKCIKNTDYEVRVEGLRFCQELCFAEGSILKFLQYPLNSWNYTKCILPDLLEILIDAIAYQDEICVRQATICLSTLATWSDKPAIENFILTYFKGHIESADWQLRNAAVIAFNSLYWDCGINSLLLAQDVLPELLDVLRNDDHIEVKKSIAVTIQKLCMVMSKLEMLEYHVKLLMNTLLSGLNMAPAIASIFCKAKHCDT